MAKSLLALIISLSLTGVVGLIELWVLEHFEAKMAGYIVASNIMGV